MGGGLEQIVERYQKRGVWLVFRADAAFARPELRFYNKRGTAEQWIKEGKYALNWTRLSCHRFVANQVRLQLFILAYNLGNFLRRLVLPRAIKDWSLRSLQAKLIKIGGRMVHHALRIIFQLSEVAISRELFAALLVRIARLNLAPGQPFARIT